MEIINNSSCKNFCFILKEFQNFLRLLYKFYKPTTGVIKIDDVDIKLCLSSRQVARSIATVLIAVFFINCKGSCLFRI